MVHILAYNAFSRRSSIFFHEVEGSEMRNNCPHCKCNEEMKINGLIWSPIQKWDKTFKDIKIPKGWRLPTIYELMQVYETDEAELFDAEYKKQWHWFFCKQTKWAKENNWLSRVYLYRVGSVYSDSVDLPFSFDFGRVVFVRDIK